MKLTFLLIFILYISLYDNLLSQNNSTTIGARQLAMGQTGTTLSDGWSAYSNNACYGEMKHFSGAIAYQNRFEMKELAIHSASIVVPTKLINFNTAYSGLNMEGFGTGKATIGLSRSFNQKFSLGFQYNYLFINYINNELMNGFFSQIGFLYHASKRIDFGINITNPENAIITNDIISETIPQRYNAGIGWHPNNKFQLLSEIEKESDLDTNFKIGAEYQAHSVLAIRCGISSLSKTLHAGFGLSVFHSQLDFGVMYHPTLKYTSIIGLQTNLNSK